MAPDEKQEKKDERQEWREARREWRRRNRGRSLIPAGALIGLGIGLLYGQPGAGVILGLGLGFLGSAFVPPAGPAGAPPGAPMVHGPRWMAVLTGIVLILVGLWIALGLLLPWTTIIAVLLILIGLGFIARAFGRMQ